MQRLHTRVGYLIALTAAGILLAGCSFGTGQSDGTPGATQGGNTSGPGGGTLECEMEGYPCSYADTDPEVLERSTEAMDEAALALDEGGDIEAAVSVLQDRRDVVEILYSPAAIRFRLEEGPAMWLINAAAITPGSKSFGAGNSVGNLTLSFEPESSQLANQDDGPIGLSERGEEPEKKALLLSPFYWEFEADETDQLHQMLKAHRNYGCEDCVSWKLNNVRERREGESQQDFDLTKVDSIDFGVSLLDFMSWHEYDLVHLSTHGTQVCRDDKCASALLTGRFVEKEEWSFEGGPGFDVPGVGWTRTAVPGCGTLDSDLASDELSEAEWDRTYEEWKNKGCATYRNRWWQLIEPAFFQHHYSDAGRSLDEKLIFISACSSMKDVNAGVIASGSTLAGAISGENTTVLGWTETVDAGAAKVVATRFYELYIKEGVRAEIAYNKVKEEFGDTFQADDLLRFKPKGIEIEALVPPEFLQEGEQDTRGREIITLIQPIFRSELEERDAVPTSGMPGDGEQDQVLLMVQIDGIDEELNPEEFSIHFAVDGTELEKTIKPQQKVGEYAYQALGMLELPFDLGDQQFVELEAWVDLPQGGESRHVLEEVELANCGWRASLSGGRNGEVRGDIVLPTSTISTATVEQLSKLAEQGFLGPETDGAGGLPTAEQLASLPEAYMLGDGEEVPFFFIIPGQGVTAIFDRTSLAVGNQVQVSKEEDSAERKQGGFSATLTDLSLQQNFSAQGQYTWHQDSFCSMDVILEMAENPFPESMLPAEFRSQ